MRDRGNKREPWTATQRVGLASIGVAIIASGAAALLQGMLHYENYWHAAVFAPFAIVIGALAVFVAIRAK
ncbi:MAG TPA: hypothetical protein VMH00_11400 [Candidatus Limnocylindrales bacterium]|nr:hypothetical protein [Candidatus Limnocylindrales bacterium]